MSKLMAGRGREAKSAVAATSRSAMSSKSSKVSPREVGVAASIALGVRASRRDESAPAVVSISTLVCRKAPTKVDEDEDGAMVDDEDLSPMPEPREKDDDDALVKKPATFCKMAKRVFRSATLMVDVPSRRRSEHGVQQHGPLVDLGAALCAGVQDPSGGLGLTTSRSSVHQAHVVARGPGDHARRWPGPKGDGSSRPWEHISHRVTVPAARAGAAWVEGRRWSSCEEAMADEATSLGGTSHLCERPPSGAHTNSCPKLLRERLMIDHCLSIAVPPSSPHTQPSPPQACSC